MQIIKPSWTKIRKNGCRFLLYNSVFQPVQHEFEVLRTSNCPFRRRVWRFGSLKNRTYFGNLFSGTFFLLSFFVVLPCDFWNRVLFWIFEQKRSDLLDYICFALIKQAKVCPQLLGYIKHNRSALIVGTLSKRSSTLSVCFQHPNKKTINLSHCCLCHCAKNVYIKALNSQLEKTSL